MSGAYLLAVLIWFFMGRQAGQPFPTPPFGARVSGECRTAVTDRKAGGHLDLLKWCQPLPPEGQIVRAGDRK